MSKKLIKIVVSVIIVGGGLGFLVAQSLGENMEYYKQADEIVADLDRWQGKRLKMGGHVTKGSIFNKQGTLDYLFTVEKNDKDIQVHYVGIVPDTFKDDAEVVVAGTITEEGIFEAHEVVAKCPSKYEAAENQGLEHPDDYPASPES